MRRKETISFEFSVNLETVEEADKTDITAIVDDWLDAFTSDDPWRREDAQRRAFDAPDRDTFAVGFDTVLQDDAWEHWNAGLEKISLQWLSDPLNLGRLETGVATEVNLAMAALRAKGAVPGGNVLNALWEELSFHARQAIGMKASEDKVRSPERAQIREDLICLLAGLNRDYRKRMDDYVRAYEWKRVVLIEQNSGTVSAQGNDLTDAIGQLLLFADRKLVLEPTRRETTGHCVYHAFHVPECLDFDPEDVHLVERWGVHVGSYTVVDAKAA
jgi:hypothetical protein